MSRPDLRHDESYNRIRVPSELKDQIYSQIADSSESLPYPDESEESLPTSTIDSQPNLDQEPGAAAGGPTSKLAESTLSSDIPTPTPEKPNPLEKFTTALHDPPQVGGIETPTNITPTQSKALGPAINRLATEDDSKLSPSSSAEQDPTRPKMPGRASTMKRIGSAIKRTISSKHE